MPCDVTYDELAEFAAAESPPERAREIEGHLADCASCRGRLDALQRADTVLARLRPVEPPARALYEVRRALAAETRRGAGGEIMTLDEVAQFLRIDDDALEAALDELPAFELAGQVRVRRAALLAWIERKEQAYARDVARSDVARLLVDGPIMEVQR